jgi:signal transduction histidine kinase
VVTPSREAVRSGGTFPDLATSALTVLVSHELRTPLAAAAGHLELLNDRAGELPPDVRWSVHALERAVHRLGDAVTMTCRLMESCAHSDH